MFASGVVLSGSDLMSTPLMVGRLRFFSEFWNTHSVLRIPFILLVVSDLGPCEVVSTSLSPPSQKALLSPPWSWYLPYLRLFLFLRPRWQKPLTVPCYFSDQLPSFCLLSSTFTLKYTVDPPFTVTIRYFYKGCGRDTVSCLHPFTHGVSDVLFRLPS